MHIKSFVIRAGRFTGAQKEAFEKYSSLYCIEYKEAVPDLTSIFPRQQDLIIEIGFGMGHATVEIAKAKPEFNFIGIEVHKPGVGTVLDKIHSGKIDNLRLVCHDAVDVLEKMIPEESVSGFHIFFPDPWPKKRHHKRRLINTSFTELLCSRLKSGAYIYTATDWEDYAHQMLQVFTECKSLVNTCVKWAEGLAWRPSTSFEKKGLEKQHLIRELYFMKK
jgi:tRNA (guanine-N7-)-methyltransferase